MALTDSQLCVFCGQKPDSKTREHVVPYWLLEMTGDPKRVVTFGQNFEKNKEPIRYSWDNFVAPACAKCNNDFSVMEGQVKPHIEALQRREPLSAGAYVAILDWLDKVRIGAWLVRHMIENYPIQITPNFHIAARIAKKDRMVAVYVFDSQIPGITMGGSDSLIFSNMPSCFGLRINNIILLNASSDFLCTRGCGLPNPVKMTIEMGGDNHGMLRTVGFRHERAVSNPITDFNLYKPVVWLYQPIKQPSSDPAFRGGYYGYTNSYDSRIAERTMEGNDRQGALFRQYSDRVQTIRSPREMICFDKVVGTDCAMQKDIVASVYDLQLHIFNSIKYKWIDRRNYKSEMAHRALKVRHTSELAEFYRKVLD